MELQVLSEVKDTRQLKKIYMPMFNALFALNSIMDDYVDRYPLIKTMGNLFFVVDTSPFSANQVNKIVTRLQEVLLTHSPYFEVEIGENFETIEVTLNINR